MPLFQFLLDQRQENKSIPEACEENAVMNCYRIKDNPRRIEFKNNTRSEWQQKNKTAGADIKNYLCMDLRVF